MNSLVELFGVSRLRDPGSLLHIVFPFTFDAGMCIRHTARSSQAGLHSDPDSRKNRYCYAIRLRVTSFIWSGRIEEHGHVGPVSSSLFHLRAGNLTCRCFCKWTPLKRECSLEIEQSYPVILPSFRNTLRGNYFPFPVKRVGTIISITLCTNICQTSNSFQN